MGEAAVQAARVVGYTNAGTVEFLLAPDGEFFFLEMNTRLQVEHPVTEMVTGMDLVEAQIRIARGERLPEPFDRLDWIEPRGHAVEVRIYAEDPFKGFVPSPGRITHLRLPEGPGVRNDCGVAEGGEISIHYDPMIGKLIVWGKDRQAALDRLGRALDEIRIEGIRTTVPLFKALLADDDFRSGEMDITMLDRKLESGELAPAEGGGAIGTAEGSDLAADLPLLAAALAHHERAGCRAARAGQGPGRAAGGSARSGWAGRARSEAVGRGPWS
jgi:acetyl-CoA carboxylase biotin carboxylase subunit